MKADRIDIGKIKPSAYQPLFDLHKNCKKSTLTDLEFLLIEIRASQINGCAYCIQMHIKEAIEKGEKQYRIHALPVWRDSPFFTSEEQIIIAMTEEITLISNNGLSETLYQKAINTFGEEKVIDIIMAICGINAWNRIGVATLLTPAPSQE
ncbi:carboxymuconolactone decarboxylase family protein [Aquimarina sp. MMG015]|uniref:carboxymuconolactone decarboxylase family protein n=1 Tax=unclassified Aquimarina TaxID=2627091 RepID=UPI000E4811EF|nr:MULTISPECIES: carboxymuconolactone decarboxylase family protein [unclassified Aquimarina]AXT56458.1 carboxymuconolactone decarboxylase family protein [Aquimarina sp. AD1]MBQ4803427.1 carboxymuconolactone decarboxylase family protein [Aquimarina sp. MMG015]RKN17468.1 carboxymuconolactone decarboxylase family protein [Aquimarina sp. AD1]